MVFWSAFSILLNFIICLQTCLNLHTFLRMIEFSFYHYNEPIELKKLKT